MNKAHTVDDIVAPKWRFGRENVSEQFSDVASSTKSKYKTF
jgi:hypothetical protein